MCYLECDKAEILNIPQIGFLLTTFRNPTLNPDLVSYCYDVCMRVNRYCTEVSIFLLLININFDCRHQTVGVETPSENGWITYQFSTTSRPKQIWELDIQPTGIYLLSSLWRFGRSYQLANPFSMSLLPRGKNSTLTGKVCDRTLEKQNCKIRV